MYLLLFIEILCLFLQKNNIYLMLRFGLVNTIDTCLSYIESFKNWGLIQNDLMNLCGRILNLQRLLCIRKTGIKCG